MNRADLCRWIGHRRSRRRAKFDYDEQHWRSVCKRCGVGLIKDDEGEWRARDAQPAPLEPGDVRAAHPLIG